MNLHLDKAALNILMRAGVYPSLKENPRCSQCSLVNPTLDRLAFSGSSVSFLHFGALWRRVLGTPLPFCMVF